jgi:hypothetical protein
MSQQKLIHIQDLTSIAANGNQVIATGLQIDTAANHPTALAVMPQRVTVEPYGADPGANFRWWETARTTAGFTLNWAGNGSPAQLNLHIVASLRHSICFDISSAVSPY